MSILISMFSTVAQPRSRAVAELHLVRPLRTLTLKTLTLTTLLLISNACLADVGDFSRATKFASPDQFLQAARSFHPATKPSELGYIFSAPELGNDQSRYGQTVIAETISKVTELSREHDLCAYFLQAEPRTDYTRYFSFDRTITVFGVSPL